MTNALIKKLETAGNLTELDHTALQGLCSHPWSFEANRDLVREGDRPESAHLILDGFAARYKLMPGDKCQILSVLIPGDFCNLQEAILGEMDYSIKTLTPCSVAVISRASTSKIANTYPRISHALAWAALADQSMMRMRLANLGQRDAINCMAHFFCEILLRLQIVGLADENSCSLPLTQPQLGDVLAMTSVHVNRTLKKLRAMNLVIFKQRRLAMPNVAELQNFCDFDPSYLHLVPRSRN